MITRLHLRQHGLTLLESLIALSILGIVAATALPTWERFIAKSALDGAYELFLNHVLLARSEAIKRGAPVTLCPSRDDRHCLDDHRAWGQGLILFANPYFHENPPSAEQIIARYKPADPDIMIATSSSHRNRLTFLPSGRSWFSNTTVRFCHANLPLVNRALVVAGHGRIRKAVVTPEACR